MSADRTLSQRTFGNQFDWTERKVKILVTNPEGTLTLTDFDELPNRFEIVTSLIPGDSTYTKAVHIATRKLFAQHGECPDDKNFWAWYVTIRKMRVSTVHHDFTVMYQRLQLHGYYSKTYVSMLLNFRLKQRDGVRKADLILTEEEIACLVRKEYNLKHTMSRLKQKALDIFVLSLFTGARYADVRTIIKSADEAGNPVLLLHNKKGTATQSIAWNPAVEGALQRKLYITRHKDDVMGACLRAALYETLPSSSNRAVSYYFLRPGQGRVLKSDSRLAHITFHVARHTFCTRLLRIGVSPAIVAQLAGHKSIQTTMKYYNWTKEIEANNILRDVYGQKAVVAKKPAWGTGASNVKPLEKKVYSAQLPQAKLGAVIPHDDGIIAKSVQVLKNTYNKPLPKKKQAIVDEAKRRGAA